MDRRLLEAYLQHPESKLPQSQLALHGRVAEHHRITPEKNLSHRVPGGS
jgi:hypothetical protein